MSDQLQEESMPQIEKRGSLLSLLSLNFYSKQEAEEFLKQASLALYFIGILQGVVSFFTFWLGLLDALIYIILGFFVGKKNRIATIIFLIVSAIALMSGVAARLGVIEGGQNIWLSLVLIWTAIRSIKAVYSIYSNKFETPPAIPKWEQDFNARQVMRETQPKWVGIVSLLVIFPSMALMAYALFQSGKLLKLYLRPDISYGYGIPFSSGYIGIVFSSLVGAIPLGLLFANIIFWIIPPIRHQMDQSAKGVPGASFKEGMRKISKIAMVIIPLVIIAIVIFALEPWTA